MAKLRFLIALIDDNSYQREQALVAKEAAQRLDVDVEIVASNDFMAQGRQLLEVIQSRSGRRPDAILVQPLTGTGLIRVAEAAAAAGIGWVVLNYDVEYVERLRPVAKAPIFVVTRDHREIGCIQGRQFAALLPEGGTILYIQGPSTSVAAVQRTYGMQSTKPDNIDVKAIRSHTWTEASACEAVTAWLRLPSARAGAINLIGCQYDGLAMGARKTFQQVAKGEDRDRWLSLPFTGVDGLPGEGQAWVNQGLLAATVVAPPVTGVAVETLFAAMTKGTVPPVRMLIDSYSYPSIEGLAPGGTRPTAWK
jgi:ribose transport system substrate-binding protein